MRRLFKFVDQLNAAQSCIPRGGVCLADGCVYWQPTGSNHTEVHAVCDHPKPMEVACQSTT